MSENAVKAFGSLAPHLRDMLAAAPIKLDRRPTAAAVQLVAHHLAYVYDPDRAGYVDDTAEQIAAAVPALSLSQIDRVLPALDKLGLWVAERRGGSPARYGTRRRPGPQLCGAAHRLGLDLSTRRQLTLDLSGDNQELGAVPRPDNQELGAVPRPDNQELGAVPRIISARYRATPKEVPKEKPPALIRDNSSSATPDRREEVIDQYAAIALAKCHAVAYPGPYKAAARRTARAHPDLDRYLEEYPTAPASAIAAWLHGETNSQLYYPRWAAS